MLLLEMVGSIKQHRFPLDKEKYQKVTVWTRLFFRPEQN